MRLLSDGSSVNSPLRRQQSNNEMSLGNDENIDLKSNEAPDKEIIEE